MAGRRAVIIGAGVVGAAPADELSARGWTDILVPALVESVTGAHAAVVDVSANRTVLELNGATVRAALQNGCPLVLHPRAFGPGRAVTTTLARIPLVLWQLGPHSYRLLPRASFADHVARWLLDAIQGFASDSRDGGTS